MTTLPTSIFRVLAAHSPTASATNQLFSSELVPTSKSRKNNKHQNSAKYQINVPLELRQKRIEANLFHQSHLFLLNSRSHKQI